MDMRIPPLEMKILLESNPPKSRILAWRLAVVLSQQILVGIILVGRLAARQPCLRRRAVRALALERSPGPSFDAILVW